MSERSVDVVVIGGGVIGCAVAWRAAQRGLSVTVLERGTPGRQATWAAAGMLSAAGHSVAATPVDALASTSLELYPAFVAELREATGVDVGHRIAGALFTAFDDAEGEHLRAMVEGQAARGHPVRVVEAAEARRLEPALSAEVRLAALNRADQVLDNRRLAQALWGAAARAGVRFRLNGAARAIDGEGVRLADGDTVRADRIVLAGGCWSGQIEGLARAVPTEPVRGQMAVVRVVPAPLGRPIWGAGGYVVPRADGRVLIGATSERAGFRPQPTAGGIRGLLDLGLRLLPALADAPLVDAWAGLRPGTPDDLPILGEDPDERRVVYATGHFRNGILLAPITADVIAAVLTGEAPRVALAAFGAERFDARRD